MNAIPTNQCKKHFFKFGSNFNQGVECCCSPNMPFEGFFIMFSDRTQLMNSSNPCDLISQLDLCCPPIVCKGFFPNCMEEWIIGNGHMDGFFEAWKESLQYSMYPLNYILNILGENCKVFSSNCMFSLYLLLWMMSKVHNIPKSICGIVKSIHVNSWNLKMK
jgi:hypothetical protein